MRRLIYLFSIVSLFINSCKSSKQEVVNELLEIDSVYTPLGGILFSDTLSFKTRFSECGEWGGHQEYLNIHWNNQKLYARLVVDSVNCDSLYRLKEYNDSNYTVFDSAKYLTLEDEYLISTMLQNVMKAYLVNYGAGGANFGDSYTIKTSGNRIGETLKLEFWNSGNNYTDINYVETMNKIFGEVKRQKNDY